MQGVDITYEDVLSMLYLCSYETVALGYSAFCPLFTQEDFEAYGYYFDIVFHYKSVSETFKHNPFYTEHIVAMALAHP